MLKKTSLLIFFAATTCFLLFAQDGGLQQSIKRGETIYQANCSSCHMPQGEGLEGVFPPLAKTDYLKNAKRAISIVVNGQQGEIIVNGNKYNTPMAALPQLSDEEVADVLNYIRNNWGNKNPIIKTAQVKAERK